MDDEGVSTPCGYVREARVVYGPRKRPELKAIKSSSDAVPLIQKIIGSSVTEYFVVISVDVRSRPIAWTTIGIGTVTFCPVSPADVLRFVLLSTGVAFILAHNHPSGDPTPSNDDVALTSRIVEGARILGLKCLDHIIVTENGYVSLTDMGMIQR